MPTIDLTEGERNALTGILLGLKLARSAVYSADAESALVKIRDAPTACGCVEAGLKRPACGRNDCPLR